jgi:hypothetical protein
VFKAHLAVLLEVIAEKDSTFFGNPRTKLMCGLFGDMNRVQIASGSAQAVCTLGLAANDCSVA